MRRIQAFSWFCAALRDARDVMPACLAVELSLMSRKPVDLDQEKAGLAVGVDADVDGIRPKITVSN